VIVININIDASCLTQLLELGAEFLVPIDSNRAWTSNPLR
jgi:hypothetical protein